MRRTHQDKGWLLDVSGRVVGLALGHDSCNEHESGAARVRALLNIPTPKYRRGMADRTMTAPPEADCFYYEEYPLKSRDKRFKKTVPAGLLVVSHSLRQMRGDDSALPSPGELASSFDVSFFWDFAADAEKQARTGGAKNDMEIAWSAEEGFAIHARGEHLPRLRQFVDLLKQGQLVMADPRACGFARHSLALVDTSAISEETRANVLAGDLALIKLHEAAAASGLAELLKSKGLGWYALEPDWVDETERELQFFLNPCEQRKHASGWFTLEELQEWANGTGPVLSHQVIEAQVKAKDPDWGYYLTSGLNAAGMPQRRHEVFVWLDEAQTEPGVRLRLAPSAKGPLTSGDYPLAALQPYVDAGRALREDALQSEVAAPA